MTYTFTTAQVKWAITAEANANPDFKYKTANGIALDDYGNCRYIKDGEPSCIVGRALVKLGVSHEDIGRYETRSAKEAICYLLELSYSDLSEIDDKNLKWIGEVQRHQDADYSWSESLQQADKYLESFNERALAGYAW